MKIFEIQTGGEKEWMYAISTIQALKEYCDVTGYSIHNFDDDDEITEVPEDEWNKLEVTFPDDSDQKVMTLEEYVKEIKAPHYMCSTVC